MAGQHRMSRRHFLKGAALLSAGGLLAACAPKVVEVEKVVKQTVVVTDTQEKVVTATPVREKVNLDWLVPGLDGNIIWKEPFQGAIDDFVANNPNVTITMTAIPWVVDRETILTRLVSGQAPDLFYTHSNRVTEIGQAMQGFAPFDEFPDWKEVSAWFPEARVETVRAKDGHYYGIPMNTLIFATACNMSILEEAGIKEPPATWSEMRQVAKAVTIPGQRWGIGWPMGAGIDTCYRLYPYALKAGSRFLNDALTEAVWNDAASLATMQAFLDFKADGSFVPGTDAWTGVEEWNAWGQGVFAIAIGGPWIPLVTPEEKLGGIRLIKTPMPDGGPIGKAPSATLSDDIMVTITRQSRHKELCWEFLKLLRDAEHDKMWLDPAMGGIPVNKASYEEPRWQDYWGHETYEEETGNAVPWPYSTILGELHNEYALAISQVWSGQKPLKEAFDGGVASCNALLAKL